MARPLTITITESREELEHRLQHETDARQQERLQMLYWLKRGLVKSRQEIAQLLNRNDSTITRWLNDYRDGGLPPVTRDQERHRGRLADHPTRGDGTAQSALSRTHGHFQAIKPFGNG